jgi:hypothetical protein
MSDTLDITGKPLQQLVLNWSAASTAEIAEAFQRTFTEASVLPNAAVLRELRELSESMETDWPLALMAVNDYWSVYAAGPRWLAVHTDIGEVVAFADLEPGDFERMRIPLPK